MASSWWKRITADKVALRRAIQAASILAALVVIREIIGFFADLQGAVDFTRNYIRPILFVPVPIVWLLITGAVVALITSFIVTRFRTREAPHDMSIYNEGQFLDKVRDFFVSARRTIRVAGLTKEWVFPLAVSVFIARRQKVQIEVTCTDGKHERYTLLEQMGCIVHRVPDLPVAGVIKDADEILSCRAVLRCPRESDNVTARYYYGPLDWYVIKSCHSVSQFVAQTGGPAPSEKPTAGFIPRLVRVSNDVLFERLRLVPFYAGAEFGFKEIEIDSTSPVAGEVLYYKLHQAEHLINLYKDQSWVLFTPSGIELRNGEVSLMVPPVIEVHDGEKYVVEGHTRLYYLRSTGTKRVNAVIIQGVQHPLPAKPTTWDNIKTADEKTGRRNPELARYIETYSHKNIWLPRSQGGTDNAS